MKKSNLVCTVCRSGMAPLLHIPVKANHVLFNDKKPFISGWREIVLCSKCYKDISVSLDDKLAEIVCGHANRISINLD